MQPGGPTDSIAGGRQPQFPRLAISDLLVLTLTVALALACVAPSLRDFLNGPDGGSALAQWHELTAEIADYTAIGIVLFGLIVLARERARGSTAPLAPGHWIFVASGPYACALLVSSAFRQLASVYWFNESPRFDASVNLGFALVLAVSVAWAIWWIGKLETRWRLCQVFVLLWLLVFVFLCFVDAARDLHDLPPNTRWIGHLLATGVTSQLLAGCVACLAIFIDLLKRVPRDWLHYCGVSALLLGGLSRALSNGRLAADWWHDLYWRLMP